MGEALRKSPAIASLWVNRDSSTVNLSGAMTGIANSSIAIDSGGGGYSIGKSAPASGSCIVVAGAGSSAQGIYTFVQQ